jgi:hypothetical protein
MGNDRLAMGLLPNRMIMKPTLADLLLVPLVAMYAED